MILFIFEGEDREPEIFKTIEELFFETKQDRIIYCYGTDIYNLYRNMVSDGDNIDDNPVFTEDVVAVLKEMEKDNPYSKINRIKNRTDVSEVYLFFDYDIHARRRGIIPDKDKMNKQLSEMLSFFNNETENGKLYVSYPMLEALRYTQKLPDLNYYLYEYPISSLVSFKEKAASFSCYKNFDFACFRFSKSKKMITPKSLLKKQMLLECWKLLKEQNVKKANYICTGNNTLPEKTTDINQELLFQKQIAEYYPRGVISIICAFPLFIFDYFGRA